MSGSKPLDAINVDSRTSANFLHLTMFGLANQKLCFAKRLLEVEYMFTKNKNYISFVQQAIVSHSQIVVELFLLNDLLKHPPIDTDRERIIINELEGTVAVILDHKHSRHDIFKAHVLNDLHFHNGPIDKLYYDKTFTSFEKRFINSQIFKISILDNQN